jgi:hypothetical protein
MSAFDIGYRNSYFKAVSILQAVTLTSESGMWNGPLTSDNVASPTFKKVTSFEVL